MPPGMRRRPVEQTMLLSFTEAIAEVVGPWLDRMGLGKPHALIGPLVGRPGRARRRVGKWRRGGLAATDLVGPQNSKSRKYLKNKGAASSGRFGGLPKHRSLFHPEIFFLPQQEISGVRIWLGENDSAAG